MVKNKFPCQQPSKCIENNTENSLLQILGWKGLTFSLFLKFEKMKYLSGIIYYCVVDGDENDGEGTAEELQGSQKPKKVLFYYKH